MQTRTPPSDALVVEYRKGWRARIVGNDAWAFRDFSGDSVILLHRDGGEEVVPVDDMYTEHVAKYVATCSGNEATDQMFIAHIGDSIARILGHTDWNDWTVK